MLTGIFGLRGKKIQKDRKNCMRTLHNSYYSPNNVGVIKEDEVARIHNMHGGHGK